MYFLVSWIPYDGRSPETVILRVTIVKTLMLSHWLAYNSSMKSEAAYLSETSVDFQLSVKRYEYYREDRTLRVQRCENLKSDMPTICLYIMVHFIFIYKVLNCFASHLCMHKAINLNCVSEVKKNVRTQIAVIIMKVFSDFYWKKLMWSFNRLLCIHPWHS